MRLGRRSIPRALGAVAVMGAPHTPAFPRAFPRWVLEWAVRWRRARRRTGWRDVAALGALLGGAAAAALVIRRAGLLLNHTGSIPVGLYRVDRVPVPGARVAGGLRRGGAAVWCLPQALSDEGRRRRYLVRGTCPSEAEPIVKFVAAVPGDTVVVTARGLHVNGALLANSRPATRDSYGRSLASVPPGVYPVRPGHAWLWSPYTALSFDSRYYGPLPAEGFVGMARPLWTAHPPLPPAAATGLLPEIAGGRDRRPP